MTTSSAAGTAIFLLLVVAAGTCSGTSISLVGVNYGLVADNLPDPSTVPPLLTSIGVGRVRLYKPDPAAIAALSSGGYELVIGVPDQCIAGIVDPAGALLWAKSNLLPHLPAAKIVSVTVGNEVLTGNVTSLSPSLVPAMKSLRAALDSIGLANATVTTTHNFAVLAASFPPSSGRFRPELLHFITPLLDFLSGTGSPFFVNAYPYFAYRDSPANISLGYALFEHNAGVVDAGTGLHYGSMLEAQVDAVYAAIAAADGRSYGGVEVRVSETGWPSAGDPNETGATPENAAAYNRNLMRMVAAGKGTPARPGTAMRAYVFALFNENLKPGAASERNYGLFRPDGTPVYDLGVAPAPATTPAGNVTGGDGSGGGGGGGMQPPGYYGFSAAAAAAVDFWHMAAAAALTAALLLS